MSYAPSFTKPHPQNSKSIISPSLAHKMQESCIVALAKPIMNWKYILRSMEYWYSMILHQRVLGDWLRIQKQL